MIDSSLQPFGPPSGNAVRQVAQLELTVVRTARQLEALAPHWERLHAEARVASIFNAWCWQSTWWRLYGRDRELHVLVATRDESVVGILPLYVDRSKYFGLPVRVLRLLGDGGDTHPDDLGPLLALGNEAAVGSALAAAMLRSPAFDIALLSDIDGESAFPAALLAEAGRAQLSCSVVRSQRIVYARLPRTWSAFVASVSAHRRTQIRRKRAKLERAQPTRFFVWSDGERLADAARQLAELHRSRWGGQSASFASPQYVELHLSAMRDALPRDRLRLYCLQVAGVIAAMLYAYRFRNRIFLVQAGFNPAYARWSPGDVLLGHAIEHAIGEGCEIVDFLRGEHDYKARIAGEQRETVCASAFRPTVGAAAFRAHQVCVRRATLGARRLARSLFPSDAAIPS
jgi:CelD/BcsL family acetyltransferase involved in cellulose biosynthesis